VQLRTRTKLFCADVADFGAPPNTHVCPVCLGLPGALPVLNRARRRARRARGARARLHGPRDSLFARKNYFYPDLPKGYQITQFERPLATGGRSSTGRSGRDARARAHPPHPPRGGRRQVAARPVPGATAVDLNRAGVPLVEIVTEPDLRSSRRRRAPS
jgi:aspartyl-tRNA(Asn)/glutamyl-tRNA(Gln) amidotransferase subunit B